MILDDIWKVYDELNLSHEDFIKNMYGYKWDVSDGLMFYPDVPYFQYCEKLIRKELPECPVFIINKSNISAMDNFSEKHTNAILVLYSKELNVNEVYHDFLMQKNDNKIYKVITYKELGNILPKGTKNSKYFDFYRRSRYIGAKENREMIKNAFSLMVDGYSKNLFVGILKRYLFSSDELLPVQPIEKQYFGEDFVRFSPNDVFVDCGAYIGDTLEMFLQKRGRDFCKYIAYEPDDKNFSQLKLYIESLSSDIKKKIVAFPFGVGKYDRIAKFMADGEASSKYSDEGNQSIQMVQLDCALSKEKPSIIKMDIEGNETFALWGLKRIIHEKAPELIICAYHTPLDFWSIPLIIFRFNPKYKFYLRAYSEYEEYVLYAIPNEEDFICY